MDLHSLIFTLAATILLHFPYFITTQQPYCDNNCGRPSDDNTTSNLGYSCNGVNKSCQTFLIYRSQPSYNTLASIASLLSTNASQISEFNINSENTALATNMEVIVPVTCSCSGAFYQSHTSYVVKSGDNIYSITNDIFRGLTTCKAIHNYKIGPNIENIYPEENLIINDTIGPNTEIIYPEENLIIPLRCACPTKRQVDEGIRYLMTFVIQKGNTLSSIATKFNTNLEQVLEANEISELDGIIQPFTTLLIPLSNPPNRLSHKEIYNISLSLKIVAASVPTVILTLLLFGACFCAYRKRQKIVKYSLDLEEFIIAVESLRFDFKTIRNATNNFSQHNKLGQGGFGSVYKGKLQNGQEIAVKRLSKNSGQGIQEFKTEVVLVEKLQHNNLVKLLGFCCHREEKLLVYELLPNASLDKMLQDRNRKFSLDWVTRYKILLGTARGLLYLHEDSRLKIIHRDLKPSNILLDEHMNPKIADFGLARLFGTDQLQAETSKIAGTYGYMAPEYALTGRFSIKSDVYSFGIIMLEIVSGYLCNSTTFPYEDESVCLRAWRLWKDGTILDLVDPSRLDGDYKSDEVTRCILTGLLCIQEDATKRPTMASIVAALNGHPVVLSEPEPPQYGSLINCQHDYSEEDDHKSSIRITNNIDEVSEICPR